MRRIRHTILLLCTCCIFSQQHLSGQDSLTIRDCVEQTYMEQVGVREQGGNNMGPEVEMYLRSAGFGPGYAWCVAMVGWVMLQHCVDIPSAPAWSPAWFPKERVICEWGDCIKAPEKGDVIGIWFTSKGRIAHGGFYHDETGNMVTTVEGNTNSSSVRDGDGVLIRYRPAESIYQISNWID